MGIRFLKKCFQEYKCLIIYYKICSFSLINKCTDIPFWEDCGELGTFIPQWWAYKLISGEEFEKFY